MVERGSWAERMKGTRRVWTEVRTCGLGVVLVDDDCKVSAIGRNSRPEPDQLCREHQTGLVQTHPQLQSSWPPIGGREERR